jgi:hypothetical protein
MVAFVTLVATTTGCGAPTTSDEQAVADPSEGTSRDELTNGQTATVDDFSGIVRLQNRVAGNLQTECIGVLWTNNTALTSEACATGAVRVVAGSQIGIVVKTFTVAQVTMVRFDHPFEVWNSTKTSHASTGYARPIWTGPSASLDGWRTRVVSIEDRAANITTQMGTFHSRTAGANGDLAVTSSGSSILTLGDAGAACFDSDSMSASTTLDAIVIAIPDPPGSVNAFAMGAEHWYPTMALTLLNGW